MVELESDRLLLRVRDLKTHFFSREGTLKAVDGVSFDLPEGGVLGIVGESGCGKSVTAQSILRLTPKSGRVVGGEILFRQDTGSVDLTEFDPRGRLIRNIRGKEIAMVFQEPMTSFIPVYTMGNQIMEVFQLHQGCSAKDARERTIEILRKVGMPRPEQVVDAYPYSLSGGMRQRAMIAMALACNPKLLIADEPTSAVDVTIQAQILQLLEDLQEELGMAIMIISHDLGVVAQTADNVMIMYLGEDVEYAAVDTLFYDPRHPYTKGLLSSVPKLGGRTKEELEPIPGTVPSLYELPSGCPFHPRCSECIPGTCDTTKPPMIEVDPGHRVRCFLYDTHSQGVRR